MMQIPRALWVVAGAWSAGFVAGILLRSDEPRAANDDAVGTVVELDKQAGGSEVAEPISRWSAMGAKELDAEYLSASDREDYMFARLLLERLAEVDIDAALAAEPDGLGSKSDIFAVWARFDPDAAEAEARRLIDEDTGLALAVAGELIESQPARALELVRDASISGSDLDSLFSRWAHSDHQAATQAAMAYALEIEEEPDGEYLDGIVDELTHRDPSLALEWVDTLPKEWREGVLEELAERWAWYDHRDALRALEAGLIADPEFADLLAQQVLYVVPERLSLEEAKAIFVRHEGTGYALEELSSTFSGREMAAIIDLKPDLADDYDDEVAATAAEWAKQEPRAAAEWAARLGTQLDPGSAVCEVCVVWAESDPGAALDFVAAQSALFEDGDDAWSALDQLIDAGVEIMDVRASLSRFAETQQPEMAIGLVGKWAVTDPTAAAEYALELGESDALASLAVGWYDGAEPDELPVISDWFSQRATEPGALDGLEHIADAWTDVDVVEASGWVAGVEDGPARDVVVRELIEDLRGVDPEAAYRWAVSLGEFVNRPEPEEYDLPELSTDSADDLSEEFSVDKYAEWALNSKFASELRYLFNDYPSRSELVQQTLEEWLEFDPGAAAEFLAGQGG